MTFEGVNTKQQKVCLELTAASVMQRVLIRTRDTLNPTQGLLLNRTEKRETDVEAASKLRTGDYRSHSYQNKVN